MLMPKCSGLIERPARAAASSMTTRPAAASSGVHSEGSHPSDNRPQRSRAAGTLPPSHTSSGCCIGSGQSLTALKWPGAPCGLPPLTPPQAPQQGQRLVDEGAALLGVDADGLALRRIGEPGDERDQQPALAQHVEARELLGK